MRPEDVAQLKRADPVWVWIVRLGRGRWLPGTVEAIQVTRGVHLVEVRVGSFSFRRRRSDRSDAVGFLAAPMRRLERRNLSADGSDRPRFVPISRLRIPERPVQVDHLHLLETDLGQAITRMTLRVSGSSIEEGSRANQTMSALRDKA